MITINATNATFFSIPFSELSTSVSSSSEILVGSELFGNSVFSILFSFEDFSRSSDVLGTDCTDLTSTSIVSSSPFGSTIASTFDSTIESTLESTSLATSCFSSFFSSRLEGFSSESKIASFSSVVGSSITSIGKFFSLRLSSASITASSFTELLLLVSSFVSSTSVLSSSATVISSEVFFVVVSSTSSDFTSSELSSLGTRSNSSVSTPSLITTVSNCEKGLFTSSFITVSGVKLILS